MGKRANLLISLAKASGIDPFHRKPTDPPVDSKTGRSIINSLLQIKWDKLNGEEQLALVRAYQVAMVRFGKPDKQSAQKIIAQLDPRFPDQRFEMNWLLCETLSFSAFRSRKRNRFAHGSTHPRGTDGICPVPQNLENRMEQETKDSILQLVSQGGQLSEPVSRSSSNSSETMLWPALALRRKRN